MNEQIIWFHGTDKRNLRGIKMHGFRAGTYFAAHLEDAICYGGPYVFLVKVQFDRASDRAWQVRNTNRIPAKAIVGSVYVVGQKKLRAAINKFDRTRPFAGKNTREIVLVTSKRKVGQTT